MGVTPYYSIYSPFFPDPVLPTRNFSILKSPPVQQEAHHALWGGGRYLPCASNRLGQNQLVPFGRPFRFRADPKQLWKPKSLALSYLRTFFSVPAHCWGMGRGWGGRIRWGWRNRQRGMARRRRDLGGRDGAVRLRRSENGRAVHQGNY